LRLAGAVQLVQRIAQIVLRLGVTGRDGDGAGECRQRLLEMAAAQMNMPQIVMTLCEIGLEFQRLAISCPGLLYFAKMQQRIAEIIIGFGIIRFQTHRTAVRCHRLPETILKAQGIAHMKVRLGETRLGGDGPLQRGLRLAMLALAELRQRAIDMHLGKVGPEGQHLTIKRFSLGEAAGLVQAQGLTQLGVEQGRLCGHGASFWTAI
jgi:hypothetical protein